MATDDDKKKDAASGENPAVKPVKSGGGVVPMILAGIVLIGAGCGVGFTVAGMFSPDATKDGTVKVETPSSAIDPMTTKEISLGDLITNIANQDGRRYIKLTCAIWMDANDVGLVLGKGGEGEIQIKRLIQMSLEEQLKRYELADLTGRGIITALTQDFAVVLDDLLRSQFPDRPKDHRFIKRVLITNLLVQ